MWIKCVSVIIVLSPSLGLGGYCRQHMQSEVERARTTSRLIMGKTQPQRPLSIISAPQIYHTTVLSAVTHSLVIGCKMRQEDPTADTSMVTRPPHHTYTMLVARLLQTQVQKLPWILQIFPYNSQQTLTAPWPTARHSVLVIVSMLECIGLAVLLCIWVWKHVEMIYLCDWV